MKAQCRVLLVAAALLAFGCASFDQSPVKGPTFVALPEPSMLRVGPSQHAPIGADIVVVQASRSSSIAMALEAYALAYQDHVGRPLLALGQHRTALPSPLDLLAPTSLTPTRVVLPLTLVTEAVVAHGRTMKGAEVPTINCRVRLFGRTSDGQFLELTTSVPIRFDPE